ncbi:MAG TPA: Y-family DNA polymerase [Pyrinomonadaceae bacterium]|nr:Y-family DNA polymerase [Pyrinomonadaceae bacterium]
MHTYAAVDCDNFYVACERVFDPRLARRPVVVLSNNDGCVISRSQEAKRLGIRMGAPLFQIRALTEAQGVRVFSSNYALYGDMSRRVMETLATFTPEVEVYSIDEAFLGLGGGLERRRGEKLLDYGHAVRERVRRWTGLPSSVGIAPTKTLAKLAVRLAKRSREGSVRHLVGAREIEEALARTPAEEVWGVGRRLARRLQAEGITTALELARADDRLIRRRMRVTGLRVVHELRGVPCLPLELCPPPRRSVTVSRSFGQTVERLEDLCEAVSFFTTRAAEKLRRARLAAGVLMVFVATNRFADGPQHEGSAVVHLPVPTALTAELIGYARRAVEEAFRPGLRYKKAGVMLLELVPESPAQRGLFDRVDRERARRVLEAVDGINRRMGPDTVRFASAGLRSRTQAWRTICERRSPRYTTRWDELLTLSAG